jgi:hypothetical protein
MSDLDADKLWYQPNLDVFLNRWFATYEEARQSLESEGGFLLPYRKHFFVCEADVIQAMGLDPDDPDWERTGKDGARPSDVEAYERLYRKREQVVRAATTAVADGVE